jgi:hypothetical protein
MDDQTSIDEYQPKLLRETSGDYAYATGINLLSLALSAFIPGGQIITALIGVKQLSPIWKRLDKWMIEVQKSLAQLQASGLRTEDLADNDAFITTVLQASHVAIRSHQQAKLDALKNAILNSALGRAPDEDMQQMFIGYLDSVTESHLLLLIRFKDQPKGTTIHSHDGKLGPTERDFPQFAGKQDFIRQIARELRDKGLLQWDAVLSSGKIIQEAGYTTPLGNEFIQFISTPSEIETQRDEGEA